MDSGIMRFYITSSQAEKSRATTIIIDYSQYFVIIGGHLKTDDGNTYASIHLIST